eukprot:COSAG02_NODE_478_length_21511_cov_120.811087_3_plen_206_part_00
MTLRHGIIRSQAFSERMHAGYRSHCSLISASEEYPNDVGNPLAIHWDRSQEDPSQIASIVWAACSADLTRVDQPGLSSVWLTPNRLTVSRPAFGSARLRTRHTPLCGFWWAPPTSKILCGVLVCESLPSAAAHLHCGSHSHRSSATVESTARIFPATEVFYGDYSSRTASTDLVHPYIYVMYNFLTLWSARDERTATARAPERDI